MAGLLSMSARRTAHSHEPSSAEDDYETVVLDGIPSSAGRKDPFARGISRKSKRAAAKAAKQAIAAAAPTKIPKGYCLVARGALRAEGGVIATGDDGTCVPDACAVMRCLLAGGQLTPATSAATIAWFRLVLKTIT